MQTKASNGFLEERKFEENTTMWPKSTQAGTVGDKSQRIKTFFQTINF